MIVVRNRALKSRDAGTYVYKVTEKCVNSLQLVAGVELRDTHIDKVTNSKGILVTEYDRLSYVNVFDYGPTLFDKWSFCAYHSQAIGNIF